MEPEREYYPNGQLKHEVPRNRAGQKDGTQRGYYENGQLFYEDFYCLGLIHGVSRWWWDDGKLEKKEYFLHDRQVTKAEYEANKE